ncbi:MULTISPECIES: M13 family metallopeptidase [unclassified Spirosoma]|uniref:M13 family metallopeptidase n=1 Tax=unclassified Spirosoma TaxID=2621999 RepID=UPI00095A31B8|nr:MULTISPECIES: M13 family metallopeptidase [unclassified Spirosoma]MBN8826400.1 M13 family metallopeptidase [Spirosoma sp.]OJW75790.1 MAG: peptidase M13 [Spirosoma sp. 48-14]
MNKQLAFLSAVVTIGLIATVAPRKFIDPANMDLSVKPGDNFYQYANGNWLRANTIPASKTSWGTFQELREKSLDAMKTLLEDASKTATKGRLYQMVGDYYASGMDSLTIEKRGFDPIKPDLARIEKVNNKAAFLDELAYQRTQSNGMLFGFSITQDRKNVSKYLPQLSQGGTTLPDRDYYLKNDARSVKIRDAYREHLNKMLALIGEEPTQASQDADVIIRLETALAKAQMPRVELRDPYKTYNKLSVSKFSQSTPSINWADQLTKFGSKDQDTVLVQSPAFFHSLDSLMAATPIEDWRTYMRWNIVKGAAPYLSDAFVKQNFAFSRTLTGQKEQTPRWQRVSSLIDGSLSDLLGQLYVQKYFKPEAKQRMLTLVDNLEASFKEHIKSLDWMSNDTKTKALAKLVAFRRKIGYPDKWKNYDGITISRNDFYGNVQAADKWQYNYMINRLGKPVDKTEWRMTPPTINASYSPVNNEITFPAAILQFPFFDFEADDAINYGGIGAVIGHEMTHGFDDSGRQYDADGTLRDWWSKTDADNFKKRADQVKEQFFGFKVLDSIKVNGQLTLGENLADLGGLAIAYDAFKKTAQGKANGKKSMIDGFTPDQRFFLSWAQIWRTNVLPETQAQLILTDPHAPGLYRCNGPVSNIDAWYQAFNVQPGDKMYKKPEARIKVW